jgi:hypothetical protein
MLMSCSAKILLLGNKCYNPYISRSADYLLADLLNIVLGVVLA